MSAQESEHQPGSHEGIHLPPPSIWPVVLAVGIAVLLLGLVLNLALLIVGVIVFVASLALWVRDARREFQELPE